MKITWKTKTVRLLELKPARYNPRKAVKKSFKGLSNTIDKVGIFEPIVVNTDMTIIGGHRRYEMYLEKGLKDVDVSYPSRELDEREEKELNILLNSLEGKTDVAMLISLGITQQFLDNLGYVEVRIPTRKEMDSQVVVAGREKNPNIVTLFYPQDQLAFVKKTLISIIKKEDTETVAGAVNYLLETYG